jgi:hypothetical protein
MALQYRLTAEEHARLSDDVRSHYKASDSGFTLETTGAAPGMVKKSELDESNRRVREFRDNNSGLNSKVTELQGQLSAYQKLGTPAEIAAKLGTALPDTEAAEKLATAERERDAARKTSAERSLKYEVGTVAMKLGVRPDAVDYLVFQAGKKFKVDDTGAIVAIDAADADTLDSWMTELQLSTPSIFHQSSGSGARGPSRQRGDDVKTISSDPVEFGANIEGIASGKVKVMG